jgi:DNA-binding transcriptional ArsR family regulator
MESGEEQVFPLRPGVAFPDWSAVRVPAARAALRTILGLFGFETRFAGYGSAEDRVRQEVLRLYKELGGAPPIDRIAEATGMEGPAVGARLEALRQMDLVTLAADGGVTGAYPLTERETEHRVRVGGVELRAMCAVDALGVGAMYGEDASIESSCHQCAAPIRITTRAKGRKIASLSPSAASVWVGACYEGQAATSLCPAIVFFCGGEHLDAWRAVNSGVEGAHLSVTEAMEVGVALFGPSLKAARAS